MKKAQKMPSYIAVRDSQYELKNASDSSTGFNDSEKNINLVLNEESEWLKYYLENKVKIRKRLHGSIKKIESLERMKNYTESFLTAVWVFSYL